MRLEALKIFIGIIRVKKRYMNKSFEFEENTYTKNLWENHIY